MAPPKRTAPPRANKEKNPGEYDWKKFKFTVPSILDMISYHVPDTIAVVCAIPIFMYFYNIGAGLAGILCVDALTPSRRPVWPPSLHSRLLRPVAAALDAFAGAHPRGALPPACPQCRGFPQRD